MDPFMQVVAPILVGIFVGVFSGMLGIGGGTIMVPAFRLLFGMSPVASTATSLFTIIPTSVSGAVSHIRHKTCIPVLGLAMGLGGALTSPLGVWLASVSPGWAIMIAVALVIGWSAYNMIKKAFAATNERGAKKKGPSAPLEIPKMTKKQLVQGACIGLVAGLASGYVGVGGGFIMMPLMLSIVGIPMKQASGTSLIAIMILAIPGVVEQALLGNVMFVSGLLVAVGSIPGALVGARLVSYVPERTLRFIFSGFLILAAVILVLNELHVLG